VLVEQVAGALGTPVLQIAFGFGSAEPGPIRVSLLRRLFSFGTFPESLQVDYVPHACLHHAINLGRERISQKAWNDRAGREPARLSSGDPQSITPGNVKKFVSLCENQ
jgi:hypothetical protein